MQEIARTLCSPYISDMSIPFKNDTGDQMMAGGPGGGLVCKYIRCLVRKPSLGLDGGRPCALRSAGTSEMCTLRALLLRGAGPRELDLARRSFCAPGRGHSMDEDRGCARSGK